MKKEDLPSLLPVFPLSNFIIFPKTTVPLNIFEPRYVEMINDSMRSNKLIGMIQPKISKENENIPKLYDIGCIGKITSFRENDNGQFLIELKGIIRFQILSEIKSNKKYRECNIEFKDFKSESSYEVSGLWESIDDAKGGPFRGYLFYDYENDRTFYISYLVFNPGGKKAFYMRQLEMIAKTIDIN